MTIMHRTETGWECDRCHSFMKDSGHTAEQPSCEHKWPGHERLRTDGNRRVLLLKDQQVIGYLSERLARELREETNDA